MCKKSPAVLYFYKKVKTTSKTMLEDQIADSPLSVHECDFISDMAKGLNITELSDKYHLSPSRISQWKREVCEKVLAIDRANIKR